MPHNRAVQLFFLYLGLILVSVTTAYPLLWMVAVSLQAPGAELSGFRVLLPSSVTLESYRVVFLETGFLRAFLNSVFVTVGVTAGQVFTSSLAAYAFARMRFFGRDRIFLGYLATMMVPGAVTMIPVFLILRSFGWVDSYLALIVPSMFSAYGTFLLRQFFLSLPRDLEVAAMVDGCTSWGIYCNVILPLSRNALLTLTILTFMGTWKGLLWPLIVTHSADLYTLPLALTKFNEMNVVQWSLLMAGAVIMTLPLLILFLFTQRCFTRGILLGAVKG